jgi:hypothetical protein
MYIKNNDTVTHVWVGRTVNPGEYRLIEDSQKERWANNGPLLKDVANSVAVVATTNTGSGDLLDINEGINALKDLPTPLLPDLSETMFEEIESESEVASTGIVLSSGQTIGISRFKGSGFSPDSHAMLVYDRGGSGERILAVAKTEDEIAFDHTLATNQLTGNGTAALQIILVNNYAKSTAMGALFEAFNV